MTKQDLIDCLAVQDFTYMDDDIYIGIFSDRNSDTVETDSYAASDVYAEDLQDDKGCKFYKNFSDLWQNFTVNGNSLPNVLLNIKGPN